MTQMPSQDARAEESNLDVKKRAPSNSILHPSVTVHVSLQGQTDPSTVELYPAVSVPDQKVQQVITKTLINPFYHAVSPRSEPDFAPFVGKNVAVNLASLLNSKELRAILNTRPAQVLYYRVLEPFPNGPQTGNIPLQPTTIRSTIFPLKIPRKQTHYEIHIHDLHPLSQLLPDQQGYIVQQYLASWVTRHKARGVNYAIPQGIKHPSIHTPLKRIGYAVTSSKYTMPAPPMEPLSMTALAAQFSVSTVVVHMLLNPDLNQAREIILIQDYVELLKDSPVSTYIYSELTRGLPSTLKADQIVGAVQKRVLAICEDFRDRPLVQPKDVVKHMGMIATKYQLDVDIVNMIITELGIRHPDSKSWLELIELKLDQVKVAFGEDYLNDVYEEYFFPKIKGDDKNPYTGEIMAQNYKGRFSISEKQLKQQRHKHFNQLEYLFGLLNEHFTNVQARDYTIEGDKSFLSQFKDSNWFVQASINFVENWVIDGSIPVDIIDDDLRILNGELPRYIKEQVRDWILAYIIVQWIMARMLDSQYDRTMAFFIMLSKLTGRSYAKIKEVFMPNFPLPGQSSTEDLEDLEVEAEMSEESEELAAEDADENDLSEETLEESKAGDDIGVEPPEAGSENVTQETTVGNVHILGTKGKKTTESSKKTPPPPSSPPTPEETAELKTAMTALQDFLYPITDPTAKVTVPLRLQKLPFLYAERHRTVTMKLGNIFKNRVPIAEDQIQFTETLYNNILQDIKDQKILPGMLPFETPATFDFPTFTKKLLLEPQFWEVRSKAAAFITEYIRLRKNLQFKFRLNGLLNAVIESVIRKYMYRQTESLQGFLWSHPSSSDRSQQNSLLSLGSLLSLPQTFTDQVSALSGLTQKSEDYPEFYELTFNPTFFHTLLDALTQELQVVWYLIATAFQETADRIPNLSRYAQKNERILIQFHAKMRMITQLMQRKVKNMLNSRPFADLMKSKPEKICVFIDDRKYLITAAEIRNKNPESEQKQFKRQLAGIEAIFSSLEQPRAPPKASFAQKMQTAVQNRLTEEIQKMGSKGDTELKKAQTDVKAFVDNHLKQVDEKSSDILHRIPAPLLRLLPPEVLSVATPLSLVNKWKNQGSQYLDTLKTAVQHRVDMTALTNQLQALQTGGLSTGGIPDIRQHIENGIRIGANAAFHGWMTPIDDRDDLGDNQDGDAETDPESNPFASSEDVRLQTVEIHPAWNLKNLYAMGQQLIQDSRQHLQSLSAHPEFYWYTLFVELCQKLFPSIQYCLAFDNPRIIDYPHFSGVVKVSTEIQQLQTELQELPKTLLTAQTKLTTHISTHGVFTDPQYQNWMNSFTVKPLDKHALPLFFLWKLAKRPHLPLYLEPSTGIKAIGTWMSLQVEHLQAIQSTLMGFFAWNGITDWPSLFHTTTEEVQQLSFWLGDCLRCFKDFAAKPFLLPDVWRLCPQASDIQKVNRWYFPVNQALQSIAVQFSSSYDTSQHLTVTFQSDAPRTLLTLNSLLEDRIKALHLCVLYLQKFLTPDRTRFDVLIQKDADNRIGRLTDQLQMVQALLDMISETNPDMTHGFQISINLTRLLAVHATTIDMDRIKIDRLTDVVRTEYRIIKTLRKVRNSTVFPIIDPSIYDRWMQIVPNTINHLISTDNAKLKREFLANACLNRPKADIPAEKKQLHAICNDPRLLNHLVNRPALFTGNGLRAQLTSEDATTFFPQLAKWFFAYKFPPPIITDQNDSFKQGMQTVITLADWLGETYASQEDRSRFRNTLKELYDALEEKVSSAKMDAITEADLKSLLKICTTISYDKLQKKMDDKKTPANFWPTYKDLVSIGRFLLTKPPQSKVTYLEIYGKKCVQYDHEAKSPPLFYELGLLEQMRRNDDLYIVQHTSEKGDLCYYFVHQLRFIDVSHGRNKHQKKIEKNNIKIGEAREQIEENTISVKEGEQQIADLEKQLVELEKQIADLEKKNQKTIWVEEGEKQMADLNKQMADLNKQMTDLNKQMTDLNKQMADLNKQMADLEKQNEALQQKIALLDAGKDDTLPHDKKYEICIVCVTRYVVKAPTLFSRKMDLIFRCTDRDPHSLFQSGFSHNIRVIRYEGHTYNHHPTEYLITWVYLHYMAILQLIEVWRPVYETLFFFPFSRLFTIDTGKVEFVFQFMNASGSPAMQEDMTKLNTELSGLYQNLLQGKTSIPETDASFSKERHQYFQLILQLFLCFRLIIQYFEVKKMDEVTLTSLATKKFSTLFTMFLHALWTDLQQNTVPATIPRKVLEEAMIKLLFQIYQTYALPVPKTKLDIRGLFRDIVSFPKMAWTPQGGTVAYVWSFLALFPMTSSPMFITAGVDRNLRNAYKMVPVIGRKHLMYPSKDETDAMTQLLHNPSSSNTFKQPPTPHKTGPKVQNPFNSIYSKYDTSTLSIKDRVTQINDRVVALTLYLNEHLVALSNRYEQLQTVKHFSSPNAQKSFRKLQISASTAQKQTHMNQYLGHLTDQHIFKATMELDTHIPDLDTGVGVAEVLNGLFSKSFDLAEWTGYLAHPLTKVLTVPVNGKTLNQVIKFGSQPDMLLETIPLPTFRNSLVQVNLERLNLQPTANDPFAWEKATWLRGGVVRGLEEIREQYGIGVNSMVPPAYTSKIYHTIGKEGKRGFLVQQDPNNPAEFLVFKSPLQAISDPSLKPRVLTATYTASESKGLVPGIHHATALAAHSPIFLESGAGNLIQYIKTDVSGTREYLYSDRDINAAVNIGVYSPFPALIEKCHLLMTRYLANVHVNYNRKGLWRYLYGQNSLCDRLIKTLEWLDPSISLPEAPKPYNYLEYRQLSQATLKSIVALLSYGILFILPRPTTDALRSALQLDFMVKMYEIAPDVLPAKEDLSGHFRVFQPPAWMEPVVYRELRCLALVPELFPPGITRVGTQFKEVKARFQAILQVELAPIQRGDAEVVAKLRALFRALDGFLIALDALFGYYPQVFAKAIKTAAGRLLKKVKT